MLQPGGYCTVAQAARRLEKHRSVVERLVRDGAVGSRTVLGRLFLDCLDIERIAGELGLTRTTTLEAAYGPDSEDDRQEDLRRTESTEQKLNRTVDRFYDDLKRKYLGGRK
jgi:hypothetical protein